MGIAEIRDAFEAYASGRLSEYELRGALRVALQEEPDSVPMYAAMATALRRRKLISADLEVAVLSDLKALTGYTGDTPPESATTPGQQAHPALQSTTRARLDESIPAFMSPDGAEALEATRSAQASDISAASHGEQHDAPLPPSIPVPSTGPGSGRSTGPGSAWDTQERLAEPEAHVMIGLVLRDRFVLVEELGRGGMGIVYKALDQREVENKGRDPYVAIKVLNEEFKRHPESARALQRESKKSMRLAHPNIVLVRDFDRHRGNVFMVMELLTGQPLDRLQRNHYPDGMPIGMVTDIVSGLGAGLSYAHQLGIVHADFKPSNAFLTNQNVVKVLDFGVARAALALDRAESTIFDAGKLNAVTPAYASIEMLIGEAPDPRDDIYALACVTYLLLTGRHPYNGIDAIRAREAAMLPAPIEGLPEHQWRAIYWALTFERESRTATVKEFVSHFCTDPGPRAARLAATARREPRLFAARSIPARNTATKPAPVAVAKPRLSAELTREIRFAHAAVRQRWAAARTRAIRLADTMVRQRWVAAHARASALASAAVRKPWLIAAPAGAVLAAAIAIFAPRQWYAHIRSEMPVLAKPQPSSEAPRPPEQARVSINPTANEAEPQLSNEASVPAAASPPSITQPEQRPASINPSAKSSGAVDGIAKLKQQLADRAAAGDVDGASTTANALRRALAGTAYAANELQQPLIASYAQLARRQMMDGHPELALQTIASGRRKFASAPELKNLEITYDRVEEEVDRLNMAPALSVRNHTAWLDEIRQLSGEDYADIEQMLARTLANDIADQRAKGDRPNVVANLLESGRKVFPEYAALLEQGKAGVLDSSQIAIAEESQDPGGASTEKDGPVATANPASQSASTK
jgi:serine/threonine protein kinase